MQVSKISLVDLAGSERADSSGAKGTRLKVTNIFVVINFIVSLYAALCITSYLLANCLAGRSKYQQISDHTGKSDFSIG